MLDVLAWLWDAVTGPVLAALELPYIKQGDSIGHVSGGYPPACSGCSPCTRQAIAALPMAAP